MSKTRKKHSPVFKAKVALEAVREHRTIAALARHYQLNANQIYKWKRQFLENASAIFEVNKTRQDATSREDELLKKIGELTVERDFLSRALNR